ncbi:hypothetical protein D3C71_1082540 [compost metagenome]
MGNFAGFQRRIEAELRPDFVADVLLVESASACSYQGHLGEPGKVRRDGAQSERNGAERGWSPVPMQEVVIDVQAVDEKFGFASLIGIDAQSILIRALDDLVVDHREIEAGRGILHWFLGSLLMHAAAVEYREQMSELHRGETTER